MLFRDAARCDEAIPASFDESIQSNLTQIGEGKVVAETPDKNIGLQV